MVAFLLASSAFAGSLSNQIEDAPAFVFAGVDYSRARFFVPETFDDPEELVYFAPGGGLDDRVQRYEKPGQAWDELTADWNTMIVNLVVPSLEDAVKRDIVTDLPTPAGQTQRRSADWWLSQYEARKSTDELDAAAIAALVKKYRVSEKKGIGLVFIMERASSEEKQACFWPTWFDLAKKTVIETDRVCEKPSGTSFRNYWLGPVLKEAKNIVKALKKGDL